MTDLTDQFFDDLAHRGYEPLLSKVTGTIRFDLAEDHRSRRWLLRIDRGRLDVTTEAVEADTVIRANRGFFNEVAAGKVTLLAAWLRNDISVEGRFQFLVMLERLLPRRGGRHPREVATAARADG